MNNHETSCLLCGGNAILKHDNYPGYQEPDTYQIYHCTECNTGFSLPRNDSSVIYENIYKNADKVPGYNRYWKYARIIKNVANPLDYLAESHEDYWSVREALKNYVNDRQTTRILEIGSGLGYLTYSLNKAGYNVTGMDVSQTAVDQANRNFGEHYICWDLFEYSEHSPESFDIVILTEVIEHVNNPVDFIRAIIKLLRPGGRTIISTPNKSFFPNDVIWASDLPPVHIWWLSEDSMKFIANELKVGISFINFREYYKMNYHLFGKSSLLENRLPRPFFNSKGELIKAISTKNGFKTQFQTVISKSNLLNKIAGTLRRSFKNFYGRSRALFSSDVIICKDRGQILCTVLIKPGNH